jgi:hypothetical protein
VTYAKGDGHFVHGDHRRIAVAALKAADVLLTGLRTRKLLHLLTAGAFPRLPQSHFSMNRNIS